MAEKEQNNKPQTSSTNTFMTGINKDIAKYAMPPESYYDAQNIRITTNHGKETAALVNVEGNEFLIDIPCSPKVLGIKMQEQIIIADTWVTTPWNVTFALMCTNGVGIVRQFTGVGGNVVDVIYSAMLSSDILWTDNNGLPVNFPDFAEEYKINIHFDQSLQYLTIWSDLVDFNVDSIIASGNLTTQQLLANSECNLEVIGFTTIRDDIYLFTTNYNGGSEEADGGPGQIWRLTYDHSTKEATLLCVYSRLSCINFTKQHPIQAIGRYENSNVQGIYWTDNFNPPRKLNVADNIISMQVDCKFLDLAPVSELQIPILQRITQGGALEAGTYQIAFRYASVEGLTTNWSPLSNPVGVYGDEQTDPYCNIQGDLADPETMKGKITNKRIEWYITGLDVSYDILEFAVVYKKSNVRSEDDHYIFKVAQNVLSTMTVELVGNEDEANKIQLAGEEFQEGIGATFETVKTLTSRDNKLFLGNVTNTAFNVEFDARAYRFKHDVGGGTISDLDSDSDLTVTINGSGLYTPGPGETALDQVPELHDVICRYNDESPDTNPDWFTQDAYIYQAGGIHLGGTGPNVNYKFVTETNAGDNVTLDAACASSWNSGVNLICGFGDPGGAATMNPLCYWFDSTPAPYNQQPEIACVVDPNAFTLGVDNLGIPVQNYDMNSSVDNFKSPYKYSLYEGYSRGEIYRFGIVFYNSKGAPSFVNWIGDIKFPYESQSDVTGSIGDFNTWQWNGTGSPTAWMDDPNFFYDGSIVTQSLGIEFTVDLSSLDLVELGITGFSIVRCDRTEDDKSKFGQAITWPVAEHSFKPPKDGTPWPAGFPERNTLIPQPGVFMYMVGTYVMASWMTENSISDMPPWMDFSIAPAEDCTCVGDTTIFENQMPKVRGPKEKHMLLYGPLNWKNSSPQEPFNLNDEKTFIAGDHLRIAGAMTPIVSLDYGNIATWNPSCATAYGGSIPGVPQPTGQWNKYYYGPTINAGNAWNTGVSYIDGIPTTLNPALVHIPLEFATWVGDGKRINSTVDPSMEKNFVNVTNPWDCKISFAMDQVNITNGLNRPRSICSEAVLVTTTDQIPYWDMLMGRSEVHTSTSQGVSPARAIVSYERYMTPYGGDTYVDRTRSIYQFCNHYFPISEQDAVSNNNPVSPLSNIVNEVYGGDVITTLFDFTQWEKNWGQAPPFTSYFQIGDHEAVNDAEWGIMAGVVVPLEVHTANSEWRHGYHFAAKGGSGNPYPDDGTNLHDEYRYLSGYNHKQDVRSYIPLPFNFNLNEEFDTRIHYSLTKVNGESSDSWATFLVGNYKDIEGIYGPLNNLLMHNSVMYYFQDKGFGMLNVNPNALVQSVDGMSLQLGTVSGGTGQFIQNFNYISSQYGAKQQWAVTRSDSSIYFFDSLKQKVFRFNSEGNTPLSDISGLHSWFNDKLIGDVLKHDNPILNKGVTATYDNKNYEALFTFHDNSLLKLYRAQVYPDTENNVPTGAMVIRGLDKCNKCITEWDCDTNGVANPLIIDKIWHNGYSVGPVAVLYMVGCGNEELSGYTWPSAQYGDMLAFIDPVLLDSSWQYGDLIDMECEKGQESYTVAYAEFANSFSSFYDFHPTIYINDGKSLITPNSQNECYNDVGIWNQVQELGSLQSTNAFRKNLYMHDIGPYGTFYDVTMASTVTLISNLGSINTKVFDNISFHMESLSVEGAIYEEDIDVRNDVFDKIRFYTDYQTTDWIELDPTGTNQNIRKVEREWKMSIPRNIMSNVNDGDIFNTSNYDPERQFRDRLRDKYMMIDLYYNNLDDITGGAKNIKFILHYFNTFFRPSMR